MKINSVFLILIISVFCFSCRKDKVQVLPPEQCADTVYFSTQILPMIQNNCVVCHSVGNGSIMELTNHPQISANANKCFNSMTASGGFILMPEGGPPLSDSLIEMFNCWIVQGKLNN